MTGGTSKSAPPTLYMLCGLPGSGKTTRARELESEGKGVLLNGDSWVWALYPDDAEVAARDNRRGLVEQVQWEVVERLLSAGVSVILDWGVWARSERDHYRRLARGLGATTELIYLDVPLAVLHERVARRNRDLPPGSFTIAPDELDDWAAQFEPPTAEEMAAG